MSNGKRFLNKANNSKDTSVGVMGCASAFLVFLSIFFYKTVVLRCMIPLVIGAIILGLGEVYFKKSWGLPSGRWSKPVSIGWLILTTFAMIAGFVLVLLVQALEISPAFLLVLAFLYAVFSFLILYSKYQKVMNSDNEEQRMLEYKGIFLTEEQIYNIENGIELPILNTPLFLKDYEVAVYDSVATRQVNTRKGCMHYTGEVVFTNERIVFLSDEKGFEVKYNAITTASAYSDGLYIQTRGNSYEILLPKTELAVIVFDAVRTGEIPIGKSEMYDETDMFEDEETEDDDFSMIDFMDGHEFEYFCADILKKNGFSNVGVTKASGDQGVDILATKDGIKYAIQCKNYSTALSNTPIQEVNAGKTFYNCHVGVVMTNSTFTSAAKTLAEATGVLLWDGEILQNMIDNAN